MRTEDYFQWTLPSQLVVSLFRVYITPSPCIFSYFQYASFLSLPPLFRRQLWSTIRPSLPMPSKPCRHKWERLSVDCLRTCSPASDLPLWLRHHDHCILYVCTYVIYICILLSFVLAYIERYAVCLYSNVCLDPGHGNTTTTTTTWSL